MGKIFLHLIFLIFQGCTWLGPAISNVDYSAQTPSIHISQGDWKLWDLDFPHGRPTYRKAGEIIIQFEEDVICREQSVKNFGMRLFTITDDICILEFDEATIENEEIGKNQDGEHFRGEGDSQTDSGNLDEPQRLIMALSQKLVSGKSNSLNFQDALKLIKGFSGIVKHAEPNFILSIQKEDGNQDKNKDFPIIQWFLEDLKIAQSFHDPEFLEKLPSPVICILDTGIYQEHHAFRKDKIFIKDNIFWNSNDHNGHGTLVAGLIAGQKGIGVNPNANIWSVKVLESDGYGEVSKIIQALDWIHKQNDEKKKENLQTKKSWGEKASLKVHIVNMSFGFYGDENGKNVEIFREKTSNLVKQGVVIVASAGNDFVDDVMYPAKFEGVIAVGSHDQGGWISRFSNWGNSKKRGVDVFAPGNDLVSTNLSSSFTHVNGTSASAAVVSGLFSLLHRDFEANRRSFLKRIQKLLPMGGNKGKERVYPEDSIVFEAHNAFNLTREKTIPKLNIEQVFNKSGLNQIPVFDFTVSQFSAEDRVFTVDENPNVIIELFGWGREPPNALALKVCIQINKEEKSPCQEEEEITLKRNFEGYYRGKYPLSNFIQRGQEGLKALVSKGGQVDIILKDKKNGDGNIAQSEFPKTKTIYFSKEKIQNANVRNLWLQPLEFFDERAKRILKAVIENTGNTHLKDITLEAYAIPAVHEGVWSVPHTLLGKKEVKIKRGSNFSFEIPIPDSFVPPEGKMTFLLTVKNEGKIIDQYLTSYHYPEKRRGLASAQFAKNVHRRLAQVAVELLGKVMKISDLHGKDKNNYLGRANSYNSWSSLIKFSEDFDIPKIPIFNTAAREKTVDDFLNFTPKSLEEGRAAGYNLISGAADPDSIDIVNNYSYVNVWDSHFWDVDSYDNDGNNFLFLNHNSALHSIRALLHGHGSPDVESNLKQGAITIYNATKKYENPSAEDPGKLKQNLSRKQKKRCEENIKQCKQVAWWMVGQALHLLGDLSVPSHVHGENWHAVYGSPYHDHLDGNDDGGVNLDLNTLQSNIRLGHGSLASIKDNFINPYCEGTKLKEDDFSPCEANQGEHDPIRFLAYTTAQIGNAFPYYYKLYPWKFENGNFDLGDRPSYERYMQKEFDKITKGSPRGFNTANYLHNKNSSRYIEKHSLPYALRAMAGLIFYFACQTQQIDESAGCVVQKDK
jgi:Subtilase family